MWHKEKTETVLEHFSTDPENGLSAAEAAARLEKYGANKLKGKPKKSLLAQFIAQLRDMLIYVLLGAAVVTIIVGEYIDAVIILAVVLLNAAIGVIQESKAEKAIEALQRMSAPRALVKREGKVQEIGAEQIVPGDLVIIDAGRVVPADLRLLKSINLQIEESVLTGESVPADKNADALLEGDNTPIGDRSNMAFMSTLVTYGRGEGIAVATGMGTEMGKIAESLDQNARELTPLQVKLEHLGKMLGYAAIGICGLILVIGWFQQRPLLELFLTAISLAVAAIPEGLPAIVAIVLALGVTRMSRIHAIVKRLPAVETLGSVNIICSDKTGTLTQNKMTVMKYYTPGGTIQEAGQAGSIPADEAAAELIRTLVLCTDATFANGKGTGDPTEIALLEFGERCGWSKTALESGYPRVAEKPFDSDRKRMSTLHQTENGYRVHTKGAIDQLLPLCTRAWMDGKPVPLTDEHRQAFAQAAEAMSGEAYRVLAAACKDADRILSPDEMEQDLMFLGFVGMIDPPRTEVKDSIQEAKMAGITPVMITGDHQTTAVAIARELGIADSLAESMTGAEIDQLSEAAFADKIKQIRVFARVSPEHKVKIVKAYKQAGNIVSMTGDGVNDAPSLKSADIGVAMGITGTDVSKGASDMILTDDNFTTIVRAVREGRNIYANIRKSVIFLLACNFGEIAAILASILLFWPVPLLATQILWINLVTDTLPAIALGVDPGEKDIMKRKPRDPKESFFAHGAGARAVLGGILIGFITLAAFYLGLYEHGYGPGSAGVPAEVTAYARTMAFMVLAASQLFYSLAMRSAHRSIFQVGLTTNKLLLGSLAAGLLVNALLIYVPFLADAFKLQRLMPADWGVVLALSLVPLAANEVLKIFLRQLRQV